MSSPVEQPLQDVIGLDVEAVLTQSGSPGCSVAVLDDGEIVFNRGFGTSRVSSGDPVTPATRLQACSMSKPVSVLAALRLVERGLLDLDADISDHLTRWTLPANGDWRPRITLRQLASHTAGLTAHAGFPGYRRGDDVPSLVEVLSSIHPANSPGARVDLVPGVQFRYSGVGTTLIQLLMEEVTGTSATELLTELVLEPLDMSASSFIQDLDDDQRAHGHRPRGKSVPGGWRVHPEQCAAGLWTTAADYLRFMGGIQRAHDGDPDALITPTTAREMLAPVAALEAPDMTGMTHIGLGFFLTVRDGSTTWFGHTGSNDGFVCASMASASGQRGSVVLLNSDNGAGAARLLLQSIAQTRQWSDVNLASDTPAGRPTSVGTHAGTYATDDGLCVGLADNDGMVDLTTPHQPTVQLQFEDSSTLSTEALDLRVRLEADGSISLDQGGHVTSLQRTTP